MARADELEWERDGIVCLRGAVPAADVAQVRGTLWRELEKRWGMVEGDPSTWTTARPHGLKSTKKASWHVDLVLSPTVRAALDELAGPRGWELPRHAGQVLVTMPEGVDWSVPWKLWHSDFEAVQSTTDRYVCKFWLLLGPSSPGGGATPQIAGSHRLFERYVTSTNSTDYVSAKHGFLESDPWLHALSSPRSEDRHRFLDAHEIDGGPVRVIECTGEPGDVYLTHPWVFHSIAANGNAEPRLMRSGAIKRWPAT